MEVDLSTSDLKRDIEKTRKALDAAYSGFNNATDFDMIDSYIYEINALQRRYNHLTNLAQKDQAAAQTLPRRHFLKVPSLFQRT